ncbi:MAG: CCA tRNA nucleotidyltransferase [Muribaculaceae bacterium]|nr:CCA tRNA nucleotidyltransferase [Muribaculaceae bacterium]
MSEHSIRTVAQVVDLLDKPLFHTIGEVADSLSLPCYAVGGCVRDLFLDRPSKDFDFVTVGSGIDLAEGVARRLGRGAHLSVFRTYGTAQVKRGKVELEFVGARKESYTSNSRNPQVSEGSLDEDLSRRDFTVNALAVKVNREGFGELVDMFDGLADMRAGILRTPLDPDVTFSDDPLRMMRAVRFASQLGFEIAPETFEAIKRNASRIRIITRERIATELMKIMESLRPSVGLTLLLDSGLLAIIFPELAAMQGVETVNGRGHKDNFYHTVAVVDNVAAVSDNVWLRWAALLHDIAKPATKRWDDKVGWTFHNHNFIGAKMVPRIFRNLRLPQDKKMTYVAKLVELHMRPTALVEDEVTDSAVRRLITYAGEDLEDLMTLCEADVTSRNREKVKRILENFKLVRAKLADLRQRDEISSVRPPVDGNDIMEAFDIPGSKLVGAIRNEILEVAVERYVDNGTPFPRKEAIEMMYEIGARYGLQPAKQID